MKKMIGLFVCLIFMGLQVVNAQSKQISGTVTSAEDGLGMPGVSVVIKGTTIGASTDIDGKYSLEASPEDVLMFSFVGMVTQEVTVGQKTVIDVVLETESIGVDEVVVTALGITREKKALGYAAQEVGGDELNQIQQSDAVSALSGRVAGVQIASSGNMGGSSRILIRGANSITQENQPLFIVDGVPMDNSNYNAGGAASGGGGIDYGNMLNDINADEIEDISVLKGAAAALYGSRAANGVVLITTKSGSKGKKGFSIDFSQSMSFETVATIPEMQKKYGGGSIVSDDAGGVNGFATVTVGGQTYLHPQYQVDESWGPRYNPNVNVVHWDGFNEDGTVKETRPWVAPANDVEDFWETGVTSTTSIGINKSGEDYGVRLAYKYTDVDGTMPNSSQKKHDFKVSTRADLTDKLSVNGSITYVRTEAMGRPEIGYGDNSVGQKFFQWGQRQLDYKRLKNYKTSTGEPITWNRKSFTDPHPKYADNPYWTAYENYSDDMRNRFYGNVSASYEIIENLLVKGSVYGDYYNFTIRERTAVGSQATPSYYEAAREYSEFNYEGIVSYSKKINDFDLSGLVGANRRDVRFDLLRGQTSGGLVVPGVYNLLNSVDPALMNDFTSERQTNSVFAQFAVGYRNMLFLEATYRTDWSSTLPGFENKYSYPSISGSFVFSELLPDITWLNMGKLRLGWAEVGNDTAPYNVQKTYEYNGDGAFMNTPRLGVPDDLLNENLKSETTRSKEIGLDLNLFNNRIDLSATYFDNTTFDQIMPLQLSQATGYASRFINAGEMTNKGIEIALGVTPVRTKDFEWNVMFNYTKVNNKLEKLYNDLESLDIQRAPFGGVFLRASLGDTYGTLWGTDFLYDDAGNKVIGSNGYYESTSDLVPLGSVLPDFTLGIRNGFSYKNFDMNFLIDIRKGGKFYSLSHMWGMYSGMYKETAGVNDKGNEIRDAVADGGGLRLDGVTGDVVWNEDGTYTVSNTAANEKYVSAAGWGARHYHGFGYPSAQSVFDADYVKLREVTIGYNIPKSFLNGIFNSARISVYGKNLFTWGLAKKGFDPEMAANGSGNVQGLEGGLQPMFRSYGFNLKLNF
ncbi:SusC/RagA family TonB-linked outer membrane protein [Marinifilum sp. D737]|jgi:TonB-linked SusC/RagA family outer membrane protein|uniref:SusC/RagA family TonB-linked outer membrane protein n=1 Tax=Marinifilum sp. D737 TaxID=2969628 RepID=UPI002276F924|nr:SusC/RagA family TonB-linked outer membrane protein [Marinifilum sp. D737]MCY1634801.1 SusC/RagA family TonB-linked outer membrane protein [Marinifilum sp. D737]